MVSFDGISQTILTPGVIRHQLETLDTARLNLANFNRIDSQYFQMVKSRFIAVTNVLQDHSITPATFRQLDNAVVTGKGYYTIVGDLVRAASANPPSKSLIGRIKTSFRHIFKTDHRMVKDLVRGVGGEEDIGFLSTLPTLHWRTHMPRSYSELFRLATQWLSAEIETHAAIIADQISDEQLRSALEVSESAITARFKNIEDERFKRFKQDLNSAEKARQPWYVPVVPFPSLIFRRSFPPKVNSLNVFTLYRRPKSLEAQLLTTVCDSPLPQNYLPLNPFVDYTLSRTTFATDPPHIKYKVRPVGLTAADVQNITADPEIVPQPIVLESAKWGFRLPDSSSLR